MQPSGGCPSNAVGPDGLAAEVLKAGQAAFGSKVFTVVERLVASEVFPVQWKGGKIVDRHKGKGAAPVCDKSRGLLSGDHVSKAVIDLLKQAIDPIYHQKVPPTQFGAVRSGGTDVPHHIIRSACDYAALADLSVCVLFVDLVKAFDRILRELIFGFPQGVTDKFPYLTSLGLSEVQAGILQQWGVDAKVIALVAALHSGSWFTYAECGQVIAVAKRGRQGCKLGCIVFNAGYTPPLLKLSSKLLARGVTMRIKRFDGDADAFWLAACEAGPQDGVDFLDVAFMDNEALVLPASAIDSMIFVTTTDVDFRRA